MTAVQYLSSDAAAKRLLPGGAVQGVSLVLFCRPDVDRGPLAAFEAAVPAGRDAFVVDVDAAPSTCRWFGVRGTSVLAAIADGALLMLETDCGPRACAEVLAGALDGLERLDSEDW